MRARWEGCFLSDLDLLASPQRVRFTLLIAPATLRKGVAHQHGAIPIVIETGVEMEGQVVVATANVNLEPEPINPLIGKEENV